MKNNVPNDNQYENIDDVMEKFKKASIIFEGILIFGIVLILTIITFTNNPERINKKYLLFYIGLMEIFVGCSRVCFGRIRRGMGLDDNTYRKGILSNIVIGGIIGTVSFFIAEQ